MHTGAPTGTAASATRCRGARPACSPVRRPSRSSRRAGWRGSRGGRRPASPHQPRLVAREGEDAAAVGRRRVGGAQLVRHREAPERRLGARPADRDGERADRAAVVAQGQPARGAVDLDREVVRDSARGARGSSRRAVRALGREHVSQPPRRASRSGRAREPNSVRAPSRAARGRAGGAQLRRRARARSASGRAARGRAARPPARRLCRR